MTTPTLRSFQADSVQQILAAPLHRWIVRYDPGLGKTPVAIRAASSLAARRDDTRPYCILVVTPAIVKRHWQAHFDTWWEGHPEVGVIRAGRGRKTGSKKFLAECVVAYASPIQIVSYQLLQHIASPQAGWDLIVFDEAHRLKDPGSKQSCAARDIVDGSPKAGVLLLSGTLIPEDIKDLWNPLDTMFQGRFGRQSASNEYVSLDFCKRYSGTVANEYSPLGHDFRGSRADTIGELRTRLDAVSSRVTRAEVAHLLPPFLVNVVKLEEKQAFTSAEAWAEGNGKAKIDAVEDWAADMETQATHLCILTYRKDTARMYFEKLNKMSKNPCVLITGDMLPDARNDALHDAARLPKAIVIATMDSIGIGIDMTFCTVAVMAELHYRMDVLLQAMFRFSRLSSKVQSSLDILCLEGSIDEQQARALKRKVDVLNAVDGTGSVGGQFAAALEAAKESDESLINKLNVSLIANMEVSDGY